MTNRIQWDSSDRMCSMEPTAGCSPTVPEPELYRSIQAVLPRDSDQQLTPAERWDSRKCIMPLLHTLMYAIIQTAYIPDELYKRVYDFCKRLLTYPHPYCTVGLSYTRQMKTERSVPGLMYQRMLTAEQRIKNEALSFSGEGVCSG
ncbi:Phosphoinositide 3-kinase regulatory subunit 6 [Larimichthys crocea]|uniref:Uncharacterized protein n=1 Tax=Larimichthys crocea TaxID=215358 RepID=A0ACD3RY49_LARCR|nr:Phosphoinositide 3-kinase regulatory subunit 6 [Larimichthys crocea]